MDRSSGQRRPHSQRSSSQSGSQYRSLHVPGPYPPQQRDVLINRSNTSSRSSQYTTSPLPLRSPAQSAEWSLSSRAGSPGRSGASQIQSLSEDASSFSQARVNQLIRALETHQINTVTDLRRAEKISYIVNNATLRNVVLSSWAYYVDSNNLLDELRGLTSEYAFSSELLNEAKYLALSDPASTQSRNMCLLVLKKIRDENLIPRYAIRVARQPSMWGDRQPSPANIQQLASACAREWSRAVSGMLRHWT